jgi:acyl carrier protein
MTAQPWPTSFEAIVRRYLPLSGDGPFDPEERLVDLGLDSMGTVALLLDLEEELSIAVPDDLITGASFDSVGSLWALVSGVRTAQS